MQAVNGAAAPKIGRHRGEQRQSPTGATCPPGLPRVPAAQQAAPGSSCRSSRWWCAAHGRQRRPAPWAARAAAHRRPNAADAKRRRRRATWPQASPPWAWAAAKPAAAPRGGMQMLSLLLENSAKRQPELVGALLRPMTQGRIRQPSRHRVRLGRHTKSHAAWAASKRQPGPGPAGRRQRRRGP